MRNTPSSNIMSGSCQLASHGPPYVDMKHARLLIVALVGLIPSAHALEQTAGSRTAQAESAMEMRLQVSNNILKEASAGTRCPA